MGRLAVEMVQPKAVIQQALRELPEEQLDGVFDIIAERGLSNMHRSLGIVPASAEFQTAADEVVGEFKELFDGEGREEFIPYDRVKATLLTEEQRYDEALEGSLDKSGLTGDISAIQVELVKGMAGVVDRGLTIPRVVDGEWRYIIEMYTDPRLSLPKERFQRVLAHELGHIPQFEYGAIGMDAKEFVALEGSMQALWNELCKIKGVEPAQAPLTSDAFSNAMLRLIPIFNGHTTTFNDKMTKYRSLVKERGDKLGSYENKMRGSKMLREGFASWVSDQVSQELGYAEDTNYAPSCAVDSPYRDGLRRLKSLPLPEALKLGLMKSSDRELVAATTQSRWNFFGR
ncbi:MAG: hypothetical protein HY362_03035 [Candidatus Aenigmarchaeota archaeon]|nr:hypothetical protein [Candidatus Aenigmarchaeota archaeon]